MSWPAWRVAWDDDPDPRHSGDSFRYDCQWFRTALTVSGNRWEENNEMRGIVALAIAAGTIVASQGVIATPQAATPHGESVEGRDVVEADALWNELHRFAYRRRCVMVPR